jgi:hypothetical protein
MGGKKSEAQNQQQQIANTQLQQMNQLLAFSKERTAQMDKLMQPAISFFTAGASGDKDAVNTALAPAIGGVTKAYDSARSNIFDQVTPGAGREFSLGQLERDKASALAGLPGQFHMQSLDQLAKFGGAEGSYALQQLGAGLGSGQAAANTNQSIMQDQTARKSAQLSVLGSIAGIGGMALGGGFKNPR